MQERSIHHVGPLPDGGIENSGEQQVQTAAGLEQDLERFGWTFAPGDKVMQIENDYDKEVYNGD